MRRTTILLLLAVAVQFGSLAWLLAARPATPLAPLPDLSLLDSITATELQRARNSCVSGDEYQSLGSSYFAYGFFPEAAVCYELANQLDPTDPRSRFEWAFCLSHAGRYAESTLRYHEAIELGAARPDCLFFIGQNHLRVGQLEDAKSVFAQAGELPVARYELQKIAMREGDLANVGQELADLRTKYPTGTDVYYLSARFESIHGRTRTANRYLDQAGRASGRLPGPFPIESDRLQDVHAAIGLARQRNEARTVLESNSEQDEATLRNLSELRWYAEDIDVLAEMAMRRKETPRALQLLNEVVDRGPTMDSLWRLGDAYAASNQPREAEQAWLGAIALGQGNYGPLAELHDGVSQFYASLNRLEEAEAQRAEGLKCAGVAAFQAGEYKDAATHLESSSKLAPNFHQTWFYLAESLRLDQKHAEAAQAYRRCLALAPNHGRAIAGVKLNEVP